MDRSSPTTNPLRSGALLLERAMHAIWRPWTRLMGWRTPASIEAYRGYGHENRVWVRGRILGNRPPKRALTTDGLCRHISLTWQRWMTFEVPAAQITVEFEGATLSVQADKDGFFEAEFPRSGASESQTRWAAATSTAQDAPLELSATHDILIVGQNAQRLVISDVDDTIIHTGATRLATIIRLTFFTGVHNRQVLEGVPRLYRSLASAQGNTNPLFYVSSSAWNLHGFITRILELGIVPRGPFMFQRLGLANNRFVREPGHRHKLAKIESLLATYPQLPAILIGDAGQHDARLYADAAKRNPGRILGIYIREVATRSSTAHDTAIDQALSEAIELGVTALRFHKSEEMRAHCAKRGWV